MVCWPFMRGTGFGDTPVIEGPTTEKFADDELDPPGLTTVRDQLAAEPPKLADKVNCPEELKTVVLFE